MTYALVMNNICVNVIVAEQEYADTLTQYQHVVPCDGRACYGVGQFYDADRDEFISVEEAIDLGLFT